MGFDFDQFMADREVARGGIADPHIAQAAAAAFLKEHKMDEPDPPFPDDSLCDCGGNLQYVEDGYTRTWQSIVMNAVGPAEIMARQPDGTWKPQLVDNVAFFRAVEDYPAGFSDEGDGEAWVECRSCLKRYELPEHFEIEYL